MSKVWYGSIENRIEERMKEKEIAVGMGATEYLYSDRKPYEVIAVEDQKHITVRLLDAKRVDNYGMSESQHYEYISNEENPTYDLTKRGDFWYTVTTMTADDLNRLAEINARAEYNDRDFSFIMWAAQFDHDKVRAKGKQTRYHKMNIRVGRAEKYYDYTF